MNPHRPALVVVTFLLAWPARSEEPPAPTATPAPKAAATNPECPDKTAAPGTANLVVTKDPATGELRPATAAEREKLLGRKPLVAPSRTVVTLPDGTVMIELGDQDMSYAVAKKNADGTITRSCVHGDPKGALAAAPSSAAPSPAPAER